MIKNVELNGYRLLDDFTADLGKLTVVIGANATGKSTLIDSLQLISESTQFPISDVFGWHGGIMFLLSAFSERKSLSWKLTFNKKNLPFPFKTILFRDEDHTYEVEIIRDLYGQAYPVHEVLRLAEPLPGDTDCFKILESHKGGSWVFNRESNKLVDFDKANTSMDDKTENDKNMAEKLSNEYVHEKDLLLAKMRFVNEYPDASLTRILISSFAFYTGFDVGRSSALRTKPSEIKPNTTLSQSGDNLGTVLHEIITRYDYKSSAEDILDFMMSAFPHVESIHPETSQGNPPGVILRFREKSMRRSMELWDLSDGFLRFICLAAALLNPSPAPFMAFDEPEAGLHPALLPVVADMIKTASERTQVLITTHSPDLLNCFDLDNIAVMAREESKILWNRPSSRKTLRKMLDEVMGETLGDLHRSGELESL